MTFKITEESIDQLQKHGEIPIQFEVRSIFEIDGDDPTTTALVEKRVPHPWLKDYDAIAGVGPTRCQKRWDVANWGLLTAYANDKRVGGCVLAFNTNGVNKLEDRNDIVALWDLRIRLHYRGMGVGCSLAKHPATRHKH